MLLVSWKLLKSVIFWFYVFILFAVFSSIRKWTLNIKIDWSLKRNSKLVLVALLCYCDAGIWLLSFNFNVICMTEHECVLYYVVTDAKWNVVRGYGIFPDLEKVLTWMFLMIRRNDRFSVHLSSSKSNFPFRERWYDKGTWIHLLAIFEFIVFFF